MYEPIYMHDAVRVARGPYKGQFGLVSQIYPGWLVDVQLYSGQVVRLHHTDLQAPKKLDREEALWMHQEFQARGLEGFFETWREKAQKMYHSRWFWPAVAGAAGLTLGVMFMLAKEVKILPISGLDKTSEEFRQRVVEMGKNLGVDPNWLLAVMAFETGSTFSPSIKNSLGFTGLIQFGSTAAKELGTTQAALAKMTAVEQLDYVERYFQNVARARGRLSTFTDVYMAVLWPAAVGKGDGFVLFRTPSSAYKANQALDWNQKGYVTAGDAASFPKRIYDKARSSVA